MIEENKKIRHRNQPQVLDQQVSRPTKQKRNNRRQRKSPPTSNTKSKSRKLKEDSKPSKANQHDRNPHWNPYENLQINEHKSEQVYQNLRNKYRNPQAVEPLTQNGSSHSFLDIQDDSI